MLGDPAQPVLDQVHADDAVAHVRADAAGEVPDWPEAEHDERAAVGNAGVTTPCQAVGRMSERYAQQSSGGPSGSLTWVNWACGTRRYSAWPPGTESYSWLKPNSAAPLSFCRTWVVSHCVYSSCLHIQQCPQEVWAGMLTRSPPRRSPQSEPISS